MRISLRGIASDILHAPLETLSAGSSSNLAKKTLACSAVGVFTLFSGGYYLKYANDFFTDRKFEYQIDQLEELVMQNKVKEVEAIFKKNPAIKLQVLRGLVIFKSTPLRNSPLLLHSAARYNHCEMVKFLIESGADPHSGIITKMYRGQPIGWGGTPLAAAIDWGRVEMVKFLLEEMRVNPNLGQYQRTPIELVSTSELDGKVQLEIIKLLIKNKAELNPEGKSLLLCVANDDNIRKCPKETREMVLLLQENGAKIPQDQRDKYASAVKFIEQGKV